MRLCDCSRITVSTAAVILALTALFAAPAQAQTFKVLHNFTGQPDGSGPLGTPLFTEEMLFGTTSTDAAIFRLNTQTEAESILYTFAAPGTGPAAGLIRDSEGNLYGATPSGGADNLGTVFKLDSAGSLTVLHNFTGPDGSAPMGALARDSQGNLYGTTKGGGVFDAGTVFKLEPSGELSTLHSFASQNDGAFPACGLLLYDGSLFGTTPLGGAHNKGIVFGISLGDGQMSVLHSFTGSNDGGAPYGGVITDGAYLYGVTAQGGSHTSGSGVVFKLSLTTFKETVLHIFAGVDGSYPYAGLTRDSQGNLYGTTVYGGAGSQGGFSGHGTVFKLDTAGVLTTLHSFTGGEDGAHPYAGLAIDGAGDLYGVVAGYRGGSIFEITQ